MSISRETKNHSKTLAEACPAAFVAGAGLVAVNRLSFRLDAKKTPRQSAGFSS